MASELTNREFYDEASSFYDQMINFESNLEKRNASLKKIFEKSGFVADLGCGTGLDSIALALNGHEVFGFDPSSKMIDLAKNNSLKYSVEINFSKNSILTIPEEYNSKFDYVVSLGNTLANVEGSVIYSTIQRIYNLLANGGIALIHILNYSLVLEKGERIVSIKPDDENFYVRFYDFINGQVNFNILTFSKSNPNNNKLLTTKIYAYKFDLLAKVFDSVGFTNMKFWSDLEKTKFNVSTSKDLFIYAEKSEQH